MADVVTGDLGIYLGKASVETRIYGLAPRDGHPPLSQGFWKVVGTDAVLGIPVLQGRPGPDGTPAVPFNWQYDNFTSASQLPTTLGASDAGKAWIIKASGGSSSIHYWDGTSFHVFLNVFAEGAPGATPDPDFAFVVDLAAGATPTVSKSGTALNPGYTVHLPSFKGDPGPTGSTVISAASWSTAPSNGSVAAWSTATSKLVPATIPVVVGPYTISESAFSAIPNTATAARTTVATINLPALPYAWRPEIVSGTIRGFNGVGSVLSVEVMLGNASSGTLVGKGPGLSGAGERIIRIGSHFSSPSAPSVAVTPASATGKVNANTTAALFVVVTRTGTDDGWSTSTTDAQLVVNQVPAL